MKLATNSKAHAKIKARKYWRRPDSLNLHEARKTAQHFSGFEAKYIESVCLLPADAASVEAMVEQMAKAMSSNAIPWDHIGYGAQQARLAAMRAALAAIGIKGGAK